MNVSPLRNGLDLSTSIRNGTGVLMPRITYSCKARIILSIACSRVSAWATSLERMGSYSTGTVNPEYTPQSLRRPGPEGSSI